MTPLTSTRPTEAAGRDTVDGPDGWHDGWATASEPVEPVGEEFALPAFGSGARSATGSRTGRGAWRRGALIALGLLLVLVNVTGGGAVSTDGPTEPAPSGTDAAATAGSTGPTLLSITDGERLLAATVLAPGADGGALMLPTGSMVEVPSFGLEPLRRTVVLGDLSLTTTVVENLLAVSISDLVALDVDDLASLFGGDGIEVVVPAPVEVVVDRGRVVTVWPAGPVTLRGDDVGRYLTDVLGDDELDLLARQQSFWRAWLPSLADGSWTPPPGLTSTQRRLVDAARAAGDGRAGTDVLPVVRLGGAVDDIDLYRIDTAALPAVVDRMMPGASTAEPVDRVRVQLLNGTGEPGLAQRVAGLLEPAGIEVVVAGNADSFDHERTQVVVYDRGDRAKAEAVREALGVGEIVVSRNPLDVVDVTVVVGTDLRG